MDEAPSSRRIVGESSVAARVVVRSVTACAATAGVTVMVKRKTARRAPRSSASAQSATAKVPGHIGVPHIVRAAAQAPVPSASNDRPGGSPVAV